MNEDLELFKDNKGDNGVGSKTQECREPALEKCGGTLRLDNMEEYLSRRCDSS